jgi:hypothetical protein
MMQVTTVQQRHSFLSTAGAAGAAATEQALSADVLLRAAARQGHRIPNEPEQQRKLLRQLTHLHFNGLQLQQLQSLRLCPRLQVSNPHHSHNACEPASLCSILTATGAVVHVCRGTADKRLCHKVQHIVTVKDIAA